MYKYEEIAAYFRLAIVSGKLAAGEKLPSLRDVSLQFSCAMSVAIQAFELLEYQGMALAVEKSGFFVSSSQAAEVPRPQQGDFSFRFAQTRVNAITARIIDTSIRNDVVQLGGAIPHPSLLPQKKLQQHMGRILREQPEVWYRYSPAKGDLSLRQEIVRLMLNKGVSVSPEDIIITNGCMEALALAIQSSVDTAGVIAIESPIFFGVIVLLEVLGVRVIEIPTTPKEGLDLDALETIAVKQPIDACLLSANFQNPLGSIMSVEKKQRLVQLASQHGFSIIEDDVFGECAFDRCPTVPIKKFDSQNNVLYCSSFSKTICPGLRVGWLIPGKQLDNCKNMKMAFTLGGPTSTQAVMAEFLKSGAYAAHIRRFQKQIAKQSFELRELVLHHFPTGTKVTRPKGGYFLWIEYEGQIDAVTLFEKALRHNISISPGPVFSVEERFHHAIRLSSGGPIDQRVAQAVAAIAAWIQ